MYYDIIQKESVDEHGQKVVELCAVTTHPVYDDISPKDMSLENQQKAGVKLERVTTRPKSKLEASDKAESSIVRNSQYIQMSEPSEPTSEPTSEPASEPASEPTPEPKS